MLRLTTLLCAFMFVTLLIGGRDYGQMRPGLAEALAEAAAPAAPQVAAVGQAETSPDATGVLAVAYTPQEAVGTTPVSTTPVVQPQPAVQAAATPEPPADDATPIWQVTARSVNVREGPSTDFAVVDKLARGDTLTLVTADEVTGWARIRVEGDGVEGFVSMDYLAPAAAN
jgi:uncharacterized protein YgiM (DUF1202 family)